MEASKLDDLKAAIDTDLVMYLAQMTKTRRFNDTQILEIGAYLGAYYTRIAQQENDVTQNDKLNIVQFICDFYLKAFPNIFTNVHIANMKRRYTELLMVDGKVVDAHLQNTMNKLM